LTDGVNGCSVQQRNRAKHAHVFDTPFTVYDRFEDDYPLHLGSNSKWRILGLDSFNQRRSLQLTAHADGFSGNGSWRWRWWWWRRREITEDSAHYTTNHATGNPSLNASRNSFRTAGIQTRLLDDLSRGFHGRSSRPNRLYWLNHLWLRSR
jgi:hypothetical protein